MMQSDQSSLECANRGMVRKFHEPDPSKITPESIPFEVVTWGDDEPCIRTEFDHTGRVLCQHVINDGQGAAL